jgi:putative ABC transport system substrate-binding protein
MKRRDFIVAVAGAVACPRALAQQAGGGVKVGILTGDSQFHRDGVALFKARLAEIGYAGSRAAIFDERFSAAPAALAEDARALASGDIDILVAFTTQPAVAAMNARPRVPMVFAVVSDPVDAGLIASLAHPGGKATGMALMQPDLSARQLQIMKDLLPRLARVAVLWNADHSGKRLEFNEISRAAQALKITVLSIEVRRAEDFAGAFATLKASELDALIVLGEPLVSSRSSEIMEIAAARHIPDMSQTSVTARQGGLISYAPNVDEQFRKAADYVDRILKGRSPKNCPSSSRPASSSSSTSRRQGRLDSRYPLAF